MSVLRAVQTVQLVQRCNIGNRHEDRGNTLMPPSACRAALETAAPALYCSFISFLTHLATLLCAFTAAFRSFLSSGFSPRFLCVLGHPPSAATGAQLCGSAPACPGAPVLSPSLAWPAVRACRGLACRGSCSCPGWLSRLVTLDSTLSQSHSRTAQASMVCVETMSPSSVSRPALRSSLAYTQHSPHTV